MSSEHSDAETVLMDTSWSFDDVPSSPSTSVDEEGAAAAKHDVALSEETESEIEPPENEEPAPPKALKKRGRPKKTGDAATPKTPAKRGRKPKAAAAGEEGEDGEPAAKKRRRRPAKAKAEAPATAPAEPSTPAAPVAPAKPTAAPATPAKSAIPAKPVTTTPVTPAKPATILGKGVKPSGTGTSTAMTHVECEYIFNSMIDAINWGNVVKETNKKAGKERQAGNVKTHWSGFVRRAIMGLYKA